jgi:hypothetical protein
MRAVKVEVGNVRLWIQPDGSWRVSLLNGRDYETVLQGEMPADAARQLIIEDHEDPERIRRLRLFRRGREIELHDGVAIVGGVPYVVPEGWRGDPFRYLREAGVL